MFGNRRPMNSRIISVIRSRSAKDRLDSLCSGDTEHKKGQKNGLVCSKYKAREQLHTFFLAGP